MAVMSPIEFPSPPDDPEFGPAQRAGFEAERLVYRMLSKLDDPWFVVWSHRTRNSEIDFICLNPDFPIILLEVKSGRFEIREGCLYQLTGVEGRKLINPIVDLKRRRDQLIDEFRASLDLELKEFDFEVALVVPVTQSFSGTILEDLKDRVFFSGDLVSRDKLMMRIRALPCKNSIGKERFSKIKAHLGRVVSSAPGNVLRVIVDDVARELERVANRVTEDPLEMVLENREVLIKGGAGAGKTYLLIELAKRLAGNGDKVLVTCYNDLLEKQLQQQLSDYRSHVTVANFHNLVIEQILHATGKADKSEIFRGWEQSFPNEEKRHYFEDYLPGKLLEVNTEPGYNPTKFEAILIDEIQDFQDGWLDSVEALLTTEGTRTHLVGCVDFAQNLRSSRERVEERRRWAMLPMRKNFRNSKKIAEYVKSEFQKIPDEVRQGMPACEPLAGCPEGRDVEFIECTSNGLMKNLEGVLERVVIQEKIPVASIAILSFRSKDDLNSPALAGHNVFWGKKVGRFILREKAGGKEEPYAIQLETAKRFKGCEQSVVIALIDKRLSERDAALKYVTFSRAREHLIVIAVKDCG
ncbi:MAG: NERD domain-containing protein [Bdellovibrionales bacterium]|nr:NERD domain-containing protein [Bdellovibrionales bacterium]